MELRDLGGMAARYAWLIVAFVAAAVGLAALTHFGETKTYSASARLALDTRDPESRAESVAIADTVKAIATSPARVSDALLNSGVTRNAEDVARDKVSVRPLGSSAIVQVSVGDGNPYAAARIANALAAEVIETRLAVTQGENQRVLAALDARITSLNRRITALDARLRDLAAAGASPSEMSPTERTRDFLAQQRSVNEAQRVTLLSNEAVRAKPSIISRAVPPRSADASRLLPDVFLAAIAALILAIGTAALMETLRGSVRGGALSRAFDAPLLGMVRARGTNARTFDSDPSIAARLAFAANTAGVEDVMLFPVGRPVDTEALAESLRFGYGRAIASDGAEQTMLMLTAEGQAGRSVSTADFVTGHSRATKPAEINVRGFGVAASDAQGGPRSGLVVVSPEALSKTELSQALQLVGRTSLPLLGLIAVRDASGPRSHLGGTVIQFGESIARKLRTR